MEDAWSRLSQGLARPDDDTTAPPPQALAGAVLVLLRDHADGDLEVVYTRRRDDLPTHPGQISFPGGRVEPGETLEEAALREAQEEVGLDPTGVEVLGRLPSFYVPPSRFWLAPVVARWRTPHPLVASEAEVAEILHVRLSRLRDAAAWRAVRLSTAGVSWAWQLDARHLLWGATAMVTTTLLELLDPEWHGGRDAGSLGRDREVRPWDVRARRVPSGGPPRLPGVPEVDLASVADAVAPDRVPDDGDLDTVAAAAADAVRRLLRAPRRRTAADPAGDVLVLAGAGGNGAAGIAAAAVLAASGVPVRVVSTVPLAQLPPVSRARAGGLQVSAFAGALPPAAAIVDALVGGGLRGPLRGRPRALLHASQAQPVPVVALDVPSGLHPEDGLLGELVAADVTVAVGAPRPGVFAPGLGPFVGDLHLAVPGGSLARIVPGVSARHGSWRE